MISLDEYREARAAQAGPDTGRTNALKGMQQEAVRATALTGSPEWDVFARYLEAQIGHAKALIATEERKLRDPMLVEQDAIMRCKIKLACLETAFQTLTDVLSLPKFIIEQGAKAADVLRERKDIVKEQ